MPKFSSLSFVLWLALFSLAPVCAEDGEFDRASEFPNYFLPKEYRNLPEEKVPTEILSKAQAKMDQALNSVFNRMTVPIYDPHTKTVRPQRFYELVRNQLAALSREHKGFDKNLEVLPSGGVVRSALSYLYAQMHEGESKGVSAEKTLDRLIHDIADLPSYLIRGVGSDFDVWVKTSHWESFKLVHDSLKDLIHKTERNYELQNVQMSDGYKRSILPIMDIKNLRTIGEHKGQLDRSLEGGGSTLDFLHYRVKVWDESTSQNGDSHAKHSGKLMEPKEHEGTIRDFLLGLRNYVEGDAEHEGRQTVRGIRPQFELPHLELKDVKILVGELQALLSAIKNNINNGDPPLDEQTRNQFAKSVRNARYSMAHNRIWRNQKNRDVVDGLIRDIVVAVGVSQSQARGGGLPLIPHYVENFPLSSKPRQARSIPQQFLMGGKDFQTKFLPDGRLYHGTPDLDIALSILRGNLRETHYETGFRRGAFSSPDEKFAMGYSSSNGTVLRLEVKDGVNFRVLDYRAAEGTQWARDREAEAKKKGIQVSDLLAREYGIDFIILSNEMVVIKNAAALEPLGLPELISSYRYAAQYDPQSYEVYRLLHRLGTDLGLSDLRAPQSPSEFIRGMLSRAKNNEARLEAYHALGHSCVANDFYNLLKNERNLREQRLQTLKELIAESSEDSERVNRLNRHILFDSVNAGGEHVENDLVRLLLSDTSKVPWGSIESYYRVVFERYWEEILFGKNPKLTRFAPILLQAIEHAPWPDFDRVVASAIIENPNRFFARYPDLRDEVHERIRNMDASDYNYSVFRDRDFLDRLRNYGEALWNDVMDKGFESGRVHEYAWNWEDPKDRDHFERMQKELQRRSHERRQSVIDKVTDHLKRRHTRRARLGGESLERKIADYITDEALRKAYLREVRLDALNVTLDSIEAKMAVENPGDFLAHFIRAPKTRAVSRYALVKLFHPERAGTKMQVVAYLKRGGVQTAQLTLSLLEKSPVSSLLQKAIGRDEAWRVLLLKELEKPHTPIEYWAWFPWRHDKRDFDFLDRHTRKTSEALRREGTRLASDSNSTHSEIRSHFREWELRKLLREKVLRGGIQTSRREQAMRARLNGETYSGPSLNNRVPVKVFCVTGFGHRTPVEVAKQMRKFFDLPITASHGGAYYYDLLAKPGPGRDAAISRILEGKRGDDALFLLELIGKRNQYGEPNLPVEVWEPLRANSAFWTRFRSDITRKWRASFPNAIGLDDYPWRLDDPGDVVLLRNLNASFGDMNAQWQALRKRVEKTTNVDFGPQKLPGEWFHPERIEDPKLRFLVEKFSEKYRAYRHFEAAVSRLAQADPIGLNKALPDHPSLDLQYPEFSEHWDPQTGKTYKYANARSHKALSHLLYDLARGKQMTEKQSRLIDFYFERKDPVFYRIALSSEGVLKERVTHRIKKLLNTDPDFVLKLLGTEHNNKLEKAHIEGFKEVFQKDAQFARLFFEQLMTRPIEASHLIAFPWDLKNQKHWNALMKMGLERVENAEEKFNDFVSEWASKNHRKPYHVTENDFASQSEREQYRQLKQLAGRTEAFYQVLTRLSQDSSPELLHFLSELDKQGGKIDFLDRAVVTPNDSVLERFAAHGYSRLNRAEKRQVQLFLSLVPRWGWVGDPIDKLMAHPEGLRHLVGRLSQLSAQDSEGPILALLERLKKSEEPFHQKAYESIRNNQKLMAEIYRRLSDPLVVYSKYWIHEFPWDLERSGDIELLKTLLKTYPANLAAERETLRHKILAQKPDYGSDRAVKVSSVSNQQWRQRWEWLEEAMDTRWALDELLTRAFLEDPNKIREKFPEWVGEPIRFQTQEEQTSSWNKNPLNIQNGKTLQDFLTKIKEGAPLSDSEKALKSLYLTRRETSFLIFMLNHQDSREEALQILRQDTAQGKNTAVRILEADPNGLYPVREAQVKIREEMKEASFSRQMISLLLAGEPHPRAWSGLGSQHHIPDQFDKLELPEGLTRERAEAELREFRRQLAIHEGVPFLPESREPHSLDPNVIENGTLRNRYRELVRNYHLAESDARLWGGSSALSCAGAFANALTLSVAP